MTAFVSINRWLVLAAGVTIATAVAGAFSPAFSQIESGFELDPYVGRLRATGGVVTVIDARRSRTIRSVVDENGTSFGLRAGYNLDRWFGIEGAFLGATNNHRADLRDLGVSVSTTENNALIFIVGNGVFHLLPGRVVPYLTAGAGILGTIERASFALNYGGGLKVFITSRIAARLEGRQFRANLKDRLEQTIPTRDGLVSVFESYEDRLRFTEVSVGLAFFF